MIRLGFGKMSIKWIQSFFLSNKKDSRGTFLVFFSTEMFYSYIFSRCCSTENLKTTHSIYYSLGKGPNILLIKTPSPILSTLMSLPLSLPFSSSPSFTTSFLSSSFSRPTFHTNPFSKISACS